MPYLLEDYRNPEDKAMFVNWLLIFEHAHKRPGGHRDHPLADPLARPEWQGLDWFIRLMGRGQRRPRNEKAPLPEKPGECAKDGYAPA